MKTTLVLSIIIIIQLIINCFLAKKYLLKKNKPKISIGDRVLYNKCFSHGATDFTADIECEVLSLSKDFKQAKLIGRSVAKVYISMDFYELNRIKEELHKALLSMTNEWVNINKINPIFSESEIRNQKINKIV